MIDNYDKVTIALKSIYQPGNIGQLFYENLVMTFTSSQLIKTNYSVSSEFGVASYKQVLKDTAEEVYNQFIIVPRFTSFLVDKKFIRNSISKININGYIELVSSSEIKELYITVINPTNELSDTSSFNIFVTIFIRGTKEMRGQGNLYLTRTGGTLKGLVYDF